MITYFSLSGEQLSDAVAVEPWKADDNCYTDSPTMIRIYDEGEPEFPWMLDAANEQGKYSEDCRTFRTREEAIAAIPSFVASNKWLPEGPTPL